MAEEEWVSLDIESKLNKKIDALQELVYQQSLMISSLSAEIKELKSDLLLGAQQSPSCQHLSLQNDRTHKLLEELKVLKQREVNLMLREKIPVPFFSSHTSPLPNPFLMKKEAALMKFNL
jgi:hypothetical protein